MGPHAVLLLVLSAVGDGSITGIGALSPNGASFTAALSEDGAAVVGWAREGALFAAVRWTRAQGLQRIHPPDWTFESYCSAVSADGTAVAGFGSDDLGGFHGFVWSAQSGLATPLASLPGGSFSTTRAVSDDGSLVMGLASDAQGKLAHVAWLSAADTPVLVESSLPGAAIEARALRRIGPQQFTWVGTAWSNASDFAVPVRFGAEQVLERVPQATGPFGKASASDASRDGVVVGTQTLAGTDTRAYVSSPTDGLQLLGTPAGWGSAAFAISADGLRIVGYLHQGQAELPVVWDRQPNGAYLARDPVALIGPAAASEWILLAVVDVSADRTSIAGVGHDLAAGGAIRGWVARVPPE